jgi:hypothetical protein
MVSRFMGGWPSSSLPPLGRFRARLKRCEADPTITRASITLDEMRAVVAALDGFKPSPAAIHAAAAAIANARAGRRGAPRITNVLDILKSLKDVTVYQEVLADAEAALRAASAVKPS